MAIAHLTFRLGDGLYALPLAAVSGVLDCAGMQDGDAVPAPFLGVVLQEQTVLPLLDLGSFLGQCRGTAADYRCVIGLETDTAHGARQAYGIVVDDVREVLPLDPHTTTAPPRIGALAPPPMLVGLQETEHGTAVLLDPDHLLPADDWVQWAAFAASGRSRV